MKFKNIEKLLSSWSVDDKEERDSFLLLYQNNKDILAKYNINILQSKSINDAIKIIEEITLLNNKNKIIKEIIPDDDLYSAEMIDVILYLYKEEIEDNKQQTKKMLLTLKNSFDSPEELECFLLNKHLKKNTKNVEGNKDDSSSIIHDDEEKTIYAPSNFNKYINLNPPESWCINKESSYNHYVSNYGEFYLIKFKNSKNNSNAVWGMNADAKSYKSFNAHNNYVDNNVMTDRIYKIIQPNIEKAETDKKEKKDNEEKHLLNQFMKSYDQYNELIKI